MINKLIHLVRLQNDIEYNNKGYKLIAIDIKVNGSEAKYLLTIEDSNSSEYNFLCKDLNSLNKLITEYGIMEMI